MYLPPSRPSFITKITPHQVNSDLRFLLLKPNTARSVSKNTVNEYGFVQRILHDLKRTRLSRGRMILATPFPPSSERRIRFYQLKRCRLGTRDFDTQMSDIKI